MTEWRGVTLDDRSAAMMAEVARLVSPYVQPTQGSYSGGVSASAGTHNGGGAIDIAAVNLTPSERDEVVAAMRRVGWAAWLRTPAQSNWPYHIHGIAVGCDDLSPAAAAQVRDYRNGLNGLAGRGRDDGPRDWVGTTWEDYLAAKAAEQAKEVAAMAANVWFMQAKGDSRIYVVAEDCSSKWHLPSPQVAADVGYIIRSGGGRVLTPPNGAPAGTLEGNPVWVEVRPETVAAIPTR